MGQTEYAYRRDLAPKIEWVKTAGQVKFKHLESEDRLQLKRLQNGESHWKKLSLEELDELKQWALKHREFMFTDGRTADSFSRNPKPMIATVPLTKLYGYFRGIKNTRCRHQFTIEERLHTCTTTYNWRDEEPTVYVTKGLFDYIDERLEQGEDSVFKDNVAERVRQMNDRYKENVESRDYVGVPENMTSKEYILMGMFQRMVSKAHDARQKPDGESLNFREDFYTRGLDIERDERLWREYTVLRVTPKTNEEITESLYEKVKWTRGDVASFDDNVEQFAKDIILNQHIADYTKRVRSQEKASQNWCEVMSDLQGAIEGLLQTTRMLGE